MKRPKTNNKTLAWKFLFFSTPYYAKTISFNARGMDSSSGSVSDKSRQDSSDGNNYGPGTVSYLKVWGQYLNLLRQIRLCQTSNVSFQATKESSEHPYKDEELGLYCLRRQACFPVSGIETGFRVKIEPYTDEVNLRFVHLEGLTSE